MMATGASTAIASDSPALKDGEALREPELPFQEVVSCKCSLADLPKRTAAPAVSRATRRMAWIQSLRVPLPGNAVHGSHTSEKSTRTCSAPVRPCPTLSRA